MIFKNYICLGAIFLFLGVFIQNTSASPCDSYREAVDEASTALSEAQEAEEAAQDAFMRAESERFYNDYVDPFGTNRGEPSDEEIDGLYTDWLAAQEALDDAQEKYDTASENYSTRISPGAINIQRRGEQPNGNGNQGSRSIL